MAISRSSHHAALFLLFASLSLVLCGTGLARQTAAALGEGGGVVFEQATTEATLESDGRSVVRRTVSARVLSEAGVQMLGQLVFSYNAATEVFRLVEIEVAKLDGTVLTPPAAGIQERAAAVDPQIAVYTDLREVHAAMPRLRPGDIVRYVTETRTEEPLAAGRFWLEHRFEKSVVVEAETLIVRVPARQPILIFQAPPLAATVADEGAYRSYAWSVSNEKTLDEPSRQESYLEPPPIQISNFSDWAEVGRWYHDLATERARPDGEVAAKARELTAGLEEPMARMRALYDFVARDVRYVSLSFGIGRYRPHEAAEVLERGYGDCKDKHTLLAALLAALDLRAAPVLINSYRDLTLDVPSPAQFDHLITMVELGDRTVWVDATAGVAPFGLLAPGLRGKRALVVAGNGRSELRTTPTHHPFDPFVNIEIEGELTALGDLHAQFSVETRGDTELALRAAYVSTPEANWSDVTTWLFLSWGMLVEILDLRVSDPIDTEAPLRIEAEVRATPFDQGDGARERLRPPLPAFALPSWEAEDEHEGGTSDTGRSEPDENAPLELDEKPRLAVRSKLTLPAGVVARPPLGVDLERPYASYRARYAVENGVLEADRSFRFRELEIVAADRSSYESFLRTVAADRGQAFVLDWAQARPVDPAAISDVEELERAASAALAVERFEEAATLLERIEALEPEHARAWTQLGRAYLELGRHEAAETLLRSHLTRESADHEGHLLLGRTLLGARKTSEAIAVLRRYAEAAPLDSTAFGALGQALFREHRFTEAIDALERASSLAPDDPRTLAILGASYLAVDRLDEGAEKLLEAHRSSDPEVLEAAATLAVQKELFAVGRQLFRRLTDLDADHPRAWFSLALAQVGEGNTELALASLDRHLEVSPDDPRGPVLRGYLTGAAEVDTDRLRESLLDNEERAMALVATAEGQFRGGDEAAARRTIEEAVSASSDELVQIRAAFLLAWSRLDLERARELVTVGLERLEAKATGLTIESDAAVAESTLQALGTGWLTVGWIAFMNNELDRALEYLESSLWLRPRAEFAETIAQIHELRKENGLAKQYFALALTLPGIATAARNSLAALLDGDETDEAATSAARAAFDASQNLRFEAAGHSLDTPLDADLLVQVGSDGKILEARAMADDETLQVLADAVVGRTHAISIPGEGPSSLLVRGVLSCEPAETPNGVEEKPGSGRCTLQIVAP